MKKLALLCILGIHLLSFGQKPKVWIYSDMTDKTLAGANKEGTLNDPDDISAMAGYLLMANMFDTKGIVVGSTHRSKHATTPNQADWANAFFGNAYAKDVIGLNKNIGGYPETISFMQSCIKETSERFNPENNYTSLETYSTVKALFDLAEKETGILNVLIWGSTTEPAMLVKHCMSTNRMDVLNKLRFVAHWTSSSFHQGSMEHPENVANCREDAQACAYLKEMALNGHIQYYECAAIGQHGIVSASPKGAEYYNQFKSSRLGKIFTEGKFVHNSVDHSDAATYWVLLENWGVGLDNIYSNGTNHPEIEKANSEKFKLFSNRIHGELLRRSKAVQGK